MSALLADVADVADDEPDDDVLHDEGQQPAAHQTDAGWGLRMYERAMRSVIDGL